MARILSIQSDVAFGHVGNAAVTFPLQSLGHEVWPVPTAVLSNHGGYPENGGTVLDVETVRSQLDGLAPRGVFLRADLVLSGYLGSLEIAKVVHGAILRARHDNAEVRYCCDPVMGDRDTGVYVAEGLVDYFRQVLLPAADILTPNMFELEILSGLPGEATVTAARHLLSKMRPGGCVLITSFEGSEVAPGQVAMAVVQEGSAWLIETPRFAFSKAPHGAGDLAAALFAAHFTESGTAQAALIDCASRLHEIFAQTALSDSAELELVAARVAFLGACEGFVARPIN